MSRAPRFNKYHYLDSPEAFDAYFNETMLILKERLIEMPSEDLAKISTRTKEVIYAWAPTDE